METNGMNLNNREEEKKDSKKTVFALSALAALGVAGALGLGFMLGGTGGDSDETSEPKREVRVSPTASKGDSTEQSATEIASTGVQPVGDASDNGEENGDESAPATNTSVPPTQTPVPATETPVAPTETPTEEPSPTETPDDGCVVCIDPAIVTLIDFTAPVFETGGRTHCDEGTIVVVTLDEEADIWVEYTYFGAEKTSETDNGSFGYFNLGGGPAIFPVMNIEVHAVDAWGNESTFNPPLYDCP